MKGRLVSYVTSKKYGFVNGEDGESYFLHASGLVNKSDESKLVKGIMVEFEPCPTPKGLSAKKVSISSVFFASKPVDFFITKASKPKYGDVVYQATIATRFFEDLEDAKKHLRGLADKVGANAILSLKYEKETFRSGNYRYSVHSYTAELALVTEKLPLESESEAIASLEDIRVRRDNFAALYNQEVKIESEARARQLNNGCALFAFSVIAIPTFLFSVYQLSGYV
ncbi:cold-shock protein [Vibrio tritonius]|uniref:cold-shock protein n=1 Tax=Vibrio tritonius TaxID=1435069 RepID=UPI000B2887A0|nr:cold shock domain-containing protein [Vibrio tritonius]